MNFTLFSRRSQAVTEPTAEPDDQVQSEDLAEQTSRQLSPSSATEPSFANQTPQGTVLVVDDTPVNRTLLSRILAAEGLQSLEAENGPEAIQMVREQKPDLLLLDILMPDLDGYAVCEMLKADPATRDVPIVFLSSLDRPADRVRGLQAGAADYITKPFDRSEVVARVRTHLALREANRRLLRRQQELEQELAAAAAIQQSLLPPKEHDFENFEIGWHYSPCDDLGGDMVGVQLLDGDAVGIYVFDVSGHGVPSALVATAVTQYLSRASGTALYSENNGTSVVPPSEVLAGLDHAYPIERFGKHLTAAYLCVEQRTGLTRYSSAAHPFPILLRANGDVARLEEGGTVIGLDGVLPFDEGEVQLYRDDRLFLFTDGVTEAENASGEAFGEDRLIDYLRGVKGASLEDLETGLMAELQQHLQGRSALDDITFMTLQWTGDQRQ